MRKRMFEVPGFPERINKETVPVLINTSDVGFPDEVTCLKWWKEQYYENPWTRMIYGHFVLMNADGSRYYGTSGCQCVEVMEHNDSFKFGQKHFDQGIKLFSAARRLEKIPKRTKSQESGLQDIYREIEHQANMGRVCGNDMRLLTGRFLADHGAQDWETVLTQLIPPTKYQNARDPLGSSMRIAATRCLAEFVSSTKPFVDAAGPHLKALYIQAGADQFLKVRSKIVKRTGSQFVNPRDVPLPPSLVRKAAYSLGRVVGQNWKKDDPKLVAKARTWWAANKDAERFQMTVKK